MEHVKDMLSEYLDKELPELELRKVRSHLAECGECRAELDELRSVSRLIGGIPKADLPLGFLHRLEARRREAPGPSPFGLLLMPQFRYAAVALTSLLVVFVVYDRAKVMFPLPAIQPMISGSAEGLSPGESAKWDGRRAESAKEEAPKPPRALVKAKGAPFAEGTSGGGAQASLRADKKSAAPSDRQLANAALARKSELTNEALQRELETQKRRMGIREIMRPEPKVFGLLAADRGSSRGRDIEFLVAAPAPATIAGTTPALLSARERRLAAGALSALPAPAPSQAFPEAADEAVYPGAAVRSATEEAELWRARGIKDPPPHVEYPRQMLVVVWGSGGPVEVAEVKQEPTRILVRYRESPAQAVDEKDARPPYSFKVVPASDLPVQFERLP